MSEVNVFSSAAELSRQLASGGLSSVGLVTAYLDRLDRIEGKVGSFLKWDRVGILAQAAASDERRAEGKCLGPLDGIPVALKDVIAVNGEQLTCGSKILEHFVSPYDATVTEKLKAAGVVLFGRLNMDEFAMGSSTENSAYQVTSNPWDLERIPGGSSGGSAAAVAAGEVPLTLGSDTGGSIRQPAALCGVVGMKPTYGLVSRYGLAAYASSLDQIGPLGRTVEDCALLLNVIVGQDKRDSTSYAPDIPDYVEALKSEGKPWKIGIPCEFFGEGLDLEVKTAVEAAMAFYKSKGCELVDVSLPHTELAVPVYYVIATAEASSNLARYDGIRYTHRSEQSENGIELYFDSRGEAFGPEVKRRIILGTYVLSSGYYDAYYVRAQKVRRLIRNDFDHAFEKVDVILTPTSPTVAFKKGEKSSDPLSMYLSDIYTISVNLAGLPGISLPVGFSKEKLPIGMQLIGPAHGESSLLQAAYLYEREHEWTQATPEL